MRYTTITQNANGSPEVKIEPVQINDNGYVVEHPYSNIASNYIASYMCDAGLIQEKYRDASFWGWLKIKCDNADQALLVAAEIEQNIIKKIAEASADRAKRTMHYIEALLASGKKLYTRGARGRFEEIR